MPVPVLFSCIPIKVILPAPPLLFILFVLIKNGITDTFFPVITLLIPSVSLSVLIQKLMVNALPGMVKFEAVIALAPVKLKPLELEGENAKVLLAYAALEGTLPLAK